MVYAGLTGQWPTAALSETLWAIDLCKPDLKVYKPPDYQG
jgi:hypothetical protein